ncbi:MAG: NADH-quinone oxidoreductase subunit NuoN [Bacillus sp. (in: firmicutes)]
MTIDELLSYNWGVMIPEFIILGTATVLALLDLFMPGRMSRRPLGWFAVGGVLLALVALIGLLDAEVTSILYDTFLFDAFGKLFKLLLLVGAVLVLLMAESYNPREGLQETRGEFYYLFLTALLGAMVMTSSADLITLFVGLELLTLSSYILVGIRKRNGASNEAAMKYVISGGIATAITLFGLSYLYGLTGSTNLIEMGENMSRIYNGQFMYLYGIAFFIVFVGLSFKIAAAPFHMWAPDVYQGSPVPVTAFLSVISKTAGFVIIIRMIVYLYTSAPADLDEIYFFMEKNKVFLAVIASVTMIIGNVVALRQKDMKRLLAYSSIAHAGYLLVALATNDMFMLSTVWFYLAAYLFMTLGAMAVIQYVSDRTDSSEIAAFAGLYKRSPFLAAAMGMFMLSMAGIPGTAGFIAKLNIFVGALAYSPSSYVLIGILMATTVVSYVYYFGVLIQLFFRPAYKEPKLEAEKIPVSLLIVMLVCMAGTIGMGIFPGLGIGIYQDIVGTFTSLF